MSDLKPHTHPPEPEDYSAHLRDFHGYSEEWFDPVHERYRVLHPEEEHGDDHFYRPAAFDAPAETESQ